MGLCVPSETLRGQIAIFVPTAQSTEIAGLQVTHRAANGVKSHFCDKILAGATLSEPALRNCLNTEALVSIYVRLQSLLAT